MLLTAALSRRGRRLLSTVAEVTVKITFIDHEGSRAVVPGRVGMSVAQVAELHGIDIGPTSMGAPRSVVHSPNWTEDLFGEGASLGYDHVQIPPTWLEKLPPRTDHESELLNTYWDPEDLSASSRLASQITLNKDLDGIQIFIPDGVPADGNF